MSACGSEDSAPVDYGSLDATMPSMDASSLGDASDAGSVDASSDAGSVDASSDAAGDSTSDAGAGANACRVVSGSQALVVDNFFDPQSAVSVAVHQRAALLSWSQYTTARSRVYSRWFDVSADPVDATSLDDGATQLEASSAPLTTGFLTTWIDPINGLRARRTADDGSTLDSASLALTSEAVDHAVSAQGADGKILVAFSRGTQGGTLLLGPDAKPVAAAHDVPGFGAIVGRPALAAFRAGYVLAWVSSGTRRLHLQVLDATGMASGTDQLFDSDGDARGNVDLAVTSTDGAVVWDVMVAGQRAEVHVHTFGKDVTPSGIERSLTPYPDTGLRPALVAARGGFLVVYRSAQSSATALRLAAVDIRGKPISENPAPILASLLQQDLPLAMRMTDDGSRIFVGWLDQTPNTTASQLQRMWIGCD